MERKLLGGPCRDRPPVVRLARLAGEILSRHEQQFLGRVETGPFAPRAAALTDTILRSLEVRYGSPPDGTDVPDRVSRLRRGAIEQKEGAPPSPRAARDLEDVDAAVRLYSYVNDYTSDEPSVEHLAEIVDKFEEDLLGVTTARPRALRRATLRFGPAVAVAPFQERRDGVRALTETLGQKVRGMLDELIAEGWRTTRPVPVMAAK